MPRERRSHPPIVSTIREAIDGVQIPFGGRGKATKFGKGGPKGPVAPKYRNPENPTETWAARGLKPRWLAAAIKGGKKPDDLLIASAAKQPKKTKKMRKTGK
jgi:DNA-binding protein H-NS